MQWYFSQVTWPLDVINANPTPSLHAVRKMSMMPIDMKILVTGGAGFIGSAVVCHIIQHSQESVAILGKLTYAGNLEFLRVASSKRYVFELVDVCNRTELERIFSIHQPNAVMHLVAESHVDRPIIDPTCRLHRNRYRRYLTLLEAARLYWNGLNEKRNWLSTSQIPLRCIC